MLLLCELVIICVVLCRVVMYVIELGLLLMYFMFVMFYSFKELFFELERF